MPGRSAIIDGMIDLHCHILHAIDDGPATIEESVQTAAALIETGYGLVVATPHMIPGTAWMPPINHVKSRVRQINEAIRLAGMELEILSGMEIALDPLIPDLLDDGRLLPLGNSSCLLVEPPFQQLPPGWRQLVFTILAKGHTILMAHPERCPQLSANPKWIEDLIQSGVYLQINWGSFLGHYGKPAKRAAIRWAQTGWIHCLATDSHHPGRRHFAGMQKAAVKLAEMIGEANLCQLTHDNPQRLLRDEPLHPMVASGRMKKHWWRFW
ncbi:tyrosine-protein phosphatase [Desulfosarcina widdelii]|nr:CpsB/CapC family capsule biosynthesis tyrosine phosphatase [Desulfosarcina widdelii]